MRKMNQLLSFTVSAVLTLAFGVVALTAGAAAPEQTDHFGDAVSAYVVALNNGQSPVPLTGSYDVTKTYRTVLHTVALMPSMICEAETGDDRWNCTTKNTFTAEDIKTTYTSNGEMLELSYETAGYDAWGGTQCVFVTIAPTAAARNGAVNSVVSGAFYYEKEIEGKTHKTPAIQFEFTLTGQTVSSVPESSSDPAVSSESSFVPPDAFPPANPEVITDMADMANSAIVEIIEGKTPSPIKLKIDPAKNYRGLLMREAMIPFIPCITDGVECPRKNDYTIKDLKADFDGNQNLFEIKFELANYDGAEWGNCVYIYILPTEDAGKASVTETVKGTLYFEKGDHRTVGIPFELVDPSAATSGEGSPQTGNNVSHKGFFAGIILSACIMFVVVISRRRKYSMN